MYHLPARLQDAREWPSKRTLAVSSARVRAALLQEASCRKNSLEELRGSIKFDFVVQQTPWSCSRREHIRVVWFSIFWISRRLSDFQHNEFHAGHAIVNKLDFTSFEFHSFQLVFDGETWYQWRSSRKTKIVESTSWLWSRQIWLKRKTFFDIFLQ